MRDFNYNKKYKNQNESVRNYLKWYQDNISWDTNKIIKRENNKFYEEK